MLLYKNINNKNGSVNKNKNGNKNGSKNVNKNGSKKLSREILDELKELSLNSKYTKINNYLQKFVFTKDKITTTKDDILKLENRKKIQESLLNNVNTLKDTYIENILELMEYKKKIKSYLKVSEILKSYTNKPTVNLKSNIDIEKKLKIFEKDKKYKNNNKNNKELETLNFHILGNVMKMFDLKTDELEKMDELKNDTGNKELEIDYYNKKLIIDNYEYNKKITYRGAIQELKIYKKFFYLLPLITDILGTIINNNSYLLLSDLNDEDNLLKNIQKSLPISIINILSYKEKNKNKNKNNNNKKGGNPVDLSDKFKVFNDIIVNLKDSRPNSFYSKFIKKKIDMKSFQSFNLIKGLEKGLEGIISFFNEIHDTLEAKRTVISETKQQTGDTQQILNKIPDIKTSKISKLIAYMKEDRKSTKKKSTNKYSSDKLKIIFKNNIDDYILNFTKGQMKGGAKKQKPKQKQKQKQKQKPKQTSKSRNSTTKKVKIVKNDEYYINPFNFLSGQYEIDKYSILKCDNKSIDLFMFFMFFIKNEKTIKTELKKLIIDKHKNIIEDVLNLNLNILFKKYEYIVYFYKLIKDIEINIMKNNNEIKNKNTNTNTNTNTTKRILSNNNKRKLLKYYKDEINKMKDITRKIELLKQNSSNNINRQILISKKINSFNIQKTDIIKSLKEIRDELL